MSLRSHTCRFLLSQPAGGAMNMALDEALLESAARAGLETRPTLRVYQWARPTLSLGYFQRAGEREAHEPSRGCELVRRPSGGGAILHDRELTYCLILPENIARSQPHAQWYFAVHGALIAALEELTSTSGALTLCSGEQEAGGRGAPDCDVEPFLCFQRRAVGDVLLGRHKIAGSAQRRRGGAILQHGSVLLARSPHAPELPGISDLLETEIAFEALSDRFADRLGAALGLSTYAQSLQPEELASAEALQSAKYGAGEWTRRR